MKAVETAKQKLRRIWREAWRPPDRRPPWAWCEDHVTSIPYSPVPGRFRSDNSPWMREPMEALVGALAPRKALRKGRPHEPVGPQDQILKRRRFG